MRERLPLIISITALVVALLGATPLGEAAKGLVVPKNSVGTPQLKKNAVATVKLRNGAVTTAKLRKNAVTSAKVKDGSLFAVDFAPGQLPGGSVGPAGPKGDPGPQGPAGKPGLADLEFVMRNTANDLQSPKILDAPCPAGKKVVGGGMARGGAADTAIVTWDAPWQDLSKWRVEAKWPSGGFPQNWQLVAYAICARVG